MSERSKRDTLRGKTIENRGYLFVYVCGRTYVILYSDPHVFVFVSCLPLPIPPLLNRIFSFCTISFRKLNYLPLRIRLFVNAACICYTQYCAVIILNFLFFKSQNIMANGYMILKPFTRRNFKNLAFFFSSCECLLSKDTGNSDLVTTENTST